MTFVDDLPFDCRGLVGFLLFQFPELVGECRSCLGFVLQVMFVVVVSLFEGVLRATVVGIVVFLCFNRS